MSAISYDPILINDWHVIALSSQVKDGAKIRATLLGEDLVVWRCNGRVNVWQDLCVHRGARLSLGWIEDGHLICAYHGWKYNCDGQCVSFPAHPNQKPPPKAHVKTYASKEKYGLVWASLGRPEKDVPEFKEWDDPNYRKIFCGPYHYRASATRAIENFLDVAHFPFVHSGLLGDITRPQIEDYDVEVSKEGIIAKNVRVWQPDPDGTGKGKVVTYTYHVFRPFTAYFSKDTDEGRFCMQFNVTPVSEVESIAWVYIALNYAKDTPDNILRSFQDKITLQDIPVVESQRPEKLPLDLQAELHLRSDRIAVAYRKWLKELGLRFGTI